MAKRALIADDNERNRKLLRVIFRKAGYETVEAEDGVQALSLARETRPDIVLMDYRMPNMNGIEATRRIVSDHPDARVIGFTLNMEENIADAMREAGAVACLSKSDPIDRLLETIRNCFPS